MKIFIFSENNLDIIEPSVFSECKNLAFIGTNPPSINSYAFSSSNISVYVPVNYNGDKFSSYNVIKTLPEFYTPSPPPLISESASPTQFMESTTIDTTVKQSYFIESATLTSAPLISNSISPTQISESTVIDTTVKQNHLDLLSNQYIFFNSEETVEIELNNGNLNLFLDNKNKIRVSLSEKDNANLSIKNQKESNIEIITIKEKDFKQKRKISFTSHSDLSAPLILNCDDGVEYVFINSIDFHKSGKISAKNSKSEAVQIILNTLNIEPQTSTNMNGKMQSFGQIRHLMKKCVLKKVYRLKVKIVLLF